MSQRFTSNAFTPPPARPCGPRGPARFGLRGWTQPGWFVGLGALLMFYCGATLWTPSAFASTYSKSENGTRVLYLFVEDLGYSVRRIPDLQSLGAAHAKTAPMVVFIGELDHREQSQAYRWVENGGQAIIALPLLAGGHCTSQRFSELSLDRVYRPKTESTTRAQDARLLMRRNACVLKPAKGMQPLAQDDEGLTVAEMPLGKGRLLIFSHDDLLKNLTLDQDDVAVLLRRWLHKNHPTGSPVAFYERRRSGAFLRMLKESRLLPLVAHGLAFLALIYWMLSRRFGDADAFSPMRRRAFAEHAKTLGSHYARARASGHVLGAHYARFFRRLRIGDRRGSGHGGAKKSGRQAENIADRVAKATQRTAEDVRDLMLQVERAIDAPGRKSPKAIRRDIMLSRSLDTLASGDTHRNAEPSKGNR